MAAPATITLTCPLCSQQLTANRTQSLSANRGPGGAANVSVSLMYNTDNHVCPAFPADVSTTPKSGARRAKPRKAGTRRAR